MSYTTYRLEVSHTIPGSKVHSDNIDRLSRASLPSLYRELIEAVQEKASEKMFNLKQVRWSSRAYKRAGEYECLVVTVEAYLEVDYLEEPVTFSNDAVHLYAVS